MVRDISWFDDIAGLIKSEDIKNNIEQRILTRGKFISVDIKQNCLVFFIFLKYRFYARKLR